jgi:O-antigen ligase
LSAVLVNAAGQPAATAARTAWCAALAFAALWLLPPLFPLAERPSLHFYREWLAGMIGVGACACWLLARPPVVFIPRTAALVLALGAFVLAQALLVDAPYRTPAAGYAAYLCWAALLAVAAASMRALLPVDRVIRAIAGAALLSGVLGAGAGLVQWFGAAAWLDALVAYAPPGSVRGNLQHQSYFADQMLTGMIGAAFLFAQRRLGGAVLVACLAWMSVSLSLSSSRATLLALPMLCTLAGVAAMRVRTRESLRLFGAVCVCTIGFVLSELAQPYLAQVLAGAERSVTTRWSGVDDEGGTAPRAVLWSKSLEILAQHPLLGVGPDGFAWHFYRSLTETTLLPYTIHSHNLLTQSLVCFGLSGTVLLSMLFGGWAWQYRDRLLSPAWWPVTAMLAVLVLRALLDLNFWFAHLLALAVVLLGLADVKGWTWQGAFPRIAIAIALAVAALALLLTLLDYRQMASIWTQRPPPHEIERRLNDARRNPLFTALVDSIVADATSVDARSGRAQLALNSRSMWWRPTPRMVWRQSALLALNGYESEACKMLSRARHVYPRQEAAFRMQLQSPAARSLAPLVTLRGQLDALAAGAPDETVPRPCPATP